MGEDKDYSLNRAFNITFTYGLVFLCRPSLTWLSVNTWAPYDYATSSSSISSPILNQSPLPFSLQLSKLKLLAFVFLSHMEGIIPFVYKAIVQYKNEKQVPAIRSWLCDSPSTSYIRLPSGDSGRFQDGSYSAASPSSTTTQILISTGVQSPLRHLTPRRVAA